MTRIESACPGPVKYRLRQAPQLQQVRTSPSEQAFDQAWAARRPAGVVDSGKAGADYPFRSKLPGRKLGAKYISLGPIPSCCQVVDRHGTASLAGSRQSHIPGQ